MVKHYLTFPPNYKLLVSESVKFLYLWFDFKSFYQQIDLTSQVCLDPLLTIFDSHTSSNIEILNFLTSTRKSQVFILICYLKVQCFDLSKYDVMGLSNFHKVLTTSVCRLKYLKFVWNLF